MHLGLTRPTLPHRCPRTLSARRMEEVRSRELRSTLEDLMYVSILEKFLLLGVEMLPRMDGEKAGNSTSVACAPPMSRYAVE